MKKNNIKKNNINVSQIIGQYNKKIYQIKG